MSRNFDFLLIVDSKVLAWPYRCLQHLVLLVASEGEKNHRIFSAFDILLHSKQIIFSEFTIVMEDRANCYHTVRLVSSESPKSYSGKVVNVHCYSDRPLWYTKRYNRPSPSAKSSLSESCLYISIFMSKLLVFNLTKNDVEIAADTHQLKLALARPMKCLRSAAGQVTIKGKARAPRLACYS